MSPFRLDGSTVKAELKFDQLKVWFLSEGTRKTVRTDRILSVTIEPNGYTKLNLAFRKDILLPTSQGEAVQLVKELNAIISEKTAIGPQVEQLHMESGNGGRSDIGLLQPFLVPCLSSGTCASLLEDCLVD